MYANKWGYIFIEKVHEFTRPDCSGHWLKMYDILEYLPKYDWIFWIDSDAFFLDFSKSLEEAIDINSKYDIHICQDVPHGFDETWGNVKRTNTGTFLIKNTLWSRRFINTLIKYKSDFSFKPFHEQSIFDRYYLSNFNGEKEKIKLYELFAFNGLSPWHRADSYIIHLMGRTREEKEWCINEISKYITSDGVSIPNSVLKEPIMNNFKK
jgi:hypothetical protein